MLPSGGYRIKIIHFCSPHLIWVDKDNVLEQIGIYGIVPKQITIDHNVATNSYHLSEFESNKWMPAAIQLMNEFFADATEIWFSLKHLDDSSIFYGMHKYGDIYGETKLGLKNLSNLLTQASFATFDEGVFHQKLSQKLNTKLNYFEMRDSIKNLNVFYKNETNKFELREENSIKIAGHVLQKLNWKLEQKETDKEYVIQHSWQKPIPKELEMPMNKQAETTISSAKEDKELTVKIKEDTKNDSNDDIIDAKYPKNVIKNDKKELKCTCIGSKAFAAIMVHSQSNKYCKPIFTISDIPFNEHILKMLKNMSITRPMAIQSITWHNILRGHSIFIIGPKCSGKSMGYLASVCRLISDGTPEICNKVGPICIIVCATAEAVTQTEKNAKMLLGFKERILAVYPGVTDLFMAIGLLNGCDLLISTPSILVKLLLDTDFNLDLSRFRIIVLDDCERMNEVYESELKIILDEIQICEDSRSDDEHKVQFVVVSRIWCDFMEPLANKIPDAIISIGEPSECAIYSKAKMIVSFVKNDKIGSVLEFLDEIDASKKVVIMVRSDDETKILEEGLKSRQNYIFACNKEMTVSDFNDVYSRWINYEAPTGPILICTDENLYNLNITDANYLVHYSLPKAYYSFKKRFFVMLDKYPSIFHSNNDSIKIKIILEEVNTEKLPITLNFLKRCTKNIPPVVDAISNKVLAKMDLMKAAHLVPVCGSLLTLGYCPDFYECQNRHMVLKGYDDPPNWVPQDGIVTFKLFHLHSAVNYSARLLTHIEDDKESKFPSMHDLYIKLSIYFGNVANRKLHGIPKVGDVCAVLVKLYLFARCQVVKILSRTRGSYSVLIKLLDEETYAETRDIYLYHLPENIISIETYAVQIRLVNLQPKDNDVKFSELALNNVKSLVGGKESYLRGRIVGVIGNCLFLDTLEVCENLISLSQVVVRHDLKQELLQMHAEEHPDHVYKINELCGPKFSTVPYSEVTTKKNKERGTWAHLNIGEFEGVYITSAINPENCLVCPSKLKSSVQLLLKDIDTYIYSKPEPLTDAEVGDIILAKFPNQGIYERARVDKINGNMINCFFVDQGDSAYVLIKDTMPITDELINKLPFQTIECRLIGIKPAETGWTDFCNTWLSNYVDKGRKHFFVKPFIKQPAYSTGGYMYSIVLIDTTSSVDIIINQLMLDLNLASTLEDEIHYLNDVLLNTGNPEDWEQLDKRSPDIPNASSLPIMIRSSDASDCDSNQSGSWEMYHVIDFASFLKHPEPNLPAKPFADNTNKSILTDKTSSIDLSEVNDLNSDDAACSSNPQRAMFEEKRQPRVLWCQDKAVVQIKIQLIGVEEYEMAIQKRSIKFSTHLHETKYAFQFELYGVIDEEKSTHCNKGRYILVKLVKIFQVTWTSLGNLDKINQWIVYDYDNSDELSDEDVDDSIATIVKKLQERE